MQSSLLHSERPFQHQPVGPARGRSLQAHRKAWALAARVVFAISPNSASCERVFALLKRLFGEQQMSSLADLVQAALMLNYNNRAVG